MFKCRVCLYVFDVGFYQPGNSNLRADCDFLADAFAIVRGMLVGYVLKLNLAKAAACWGVVPKNIKRAFAGVEASAAKISLRFFICLPDFVLKRLPIWGTLQIFVKSLIGFHS